MPHVDVSLLVHSPECLILLIDRLNLYVPRARHLTQWDRIFIIDSFSGGRSSTLKTFQWHIFPRSGTLDVKVALNLDGRLMRNGELLGAALLGTWDQSERLL